MAITRNKSQRQFTIVAQSILRDERLSLKDVGLLVHLLSLPDNWEFSEKGLMKLFKQDGKDSIRTGLKHLEEHGYLVRTTVRDEAGRWSNVEWNIFDSPHAEQAENPESEKPNSGNSRSENLPQYNTKESNTKEKSNTNSSSYPLGNSSSRPLENLTEEEKDKADKEVENDKYYCPDDGRPSFNTAEAYASSNLKYLSPTNMEELIAFQDELPDEVIKYAIDEACAQGKRTWGYARTILLNLEREGVKTVGEAKASQESFRRRKEAQASPQKPKPFYGQKVFR